MVFIMLGTCPDNSAVSPTVFWILEYQLGFFLSGVAGELFACLLEGKPVPTFPVCLCRRKKGAVPRISRLILSGLQFGSSLGKALELLTKHGLDTERRKEFPVEAAMESLLSTSPLMVAAAPDMDLMSCVDYFLDRCVGDDGEIAKRFAHMPVEMILRSNTNQHKVGPADIPKLRDKAKRSLQVCICVYWDELG